MAKPSDNNEYCLRESIRVFPVLRVPDLPSSFVSYMARGTHHNRSSSCRKKLPYRQDFAILLSSQLEPVTALFPLFQVQLLYKASNDTFPLLLFQPFPHRTPLIRHRLPRSDNSN